LFRHVDQLARDDVSVCGLRLYVDNGNRAAQETYHRLGLGTTRYAIMELEYPARGAHKEVSDAEAR
jgi:ribosomal protein S18 acetylase RimI-like enzyme